MEKNNIMFKNIGEKSIKRRLLRKGGGGKGNSLIVSKYKIEKYFEVTWPSYGLKQLRKS